MTYDDINWQYNFRIQTYRYCRVEVWGKKSTEALRCDCTCSSRARNVTFVTIHPCPLMEDYEDTGDDDDRVHQLTEEAVHTGHLDLSSL